MRSDGGLANRLQAPEPALRPFGGLTLPSVRAVPKAPRCPVSLFPAFLFQVDAQGHEYGIELAFDSEARWLTAEFEAGDVLLLSMMTIHGSVKNCANYTRLSLDVRWQPVADEWVVEAFEGAAGEVKAVGDVAGFGLSLKAVRDAIEVAYAI